MAEEGGTPWMLSSLRIINDKVLPRRQLETHWLCRPQSIHLRAQAHQPATFRVSDIRVARWHGARAS